MTSASQLIATLQGHELVLGGELNALNADIVMLQQMHARYAVQCGISSFEVALQQLLALRSEKERLLAQVVSQLRTMQDHVASSSFLVHQIAAVNGVAPAAGFVSALPTTGTWIASPSRATASIHVPPAVIDPPGVSRLSAAPPLVQVVTPSGLVVTTNSTILANSPSRLR